MRNLPLLFSVGFATVAYAHQPPSVCMLLSPTVTLTAGQSISAIVENDQGKPCLATLAFSNDNFLPVTFDLQPTACLGYQLAEISIPADAPNGNVSVLWECAGDNTSTCIQASIDGGSGNADTLMLQQKGTMRCLVPSIASSTLSTVVIQMSTITSASTTTSSTTEGTGITGSTSSSATGSTGSTGSTWSTTSSTSGSVPMSPSISSLVTPVADIQSTTTNSLTSSSTKCPCGQGNGSPFN